MTLPKSVEKLVHNEYLNRYIERLGITPTPETVKFLRKRMPRENVRILAAWKAQGWKDDSVQVTPIMKTVQNEQWLASSDDMLATVVRKEENVFQGLRDKLAAASATAQVPHALRASKASDRPSNQSRRGSNDSVLVESTLNHKADLTKFTKQQKKAQKDQRTMCLIHFNQAHAYLHYARDRHLAKQKADEGSASSGVRGGKEVDNSTVELEAARARRKNKELPGEDIERYEEVKRPLSTNGGKIQDFQRAFFAAFPFQRFPVEGGHGGQGGQAKAEGNAVQQAKYTLQSKKTSQLIALLCHFLYWTLFGSYSQSELDPDKKERILMSIQKLHIDIDHTMRKRKHYTLFHLPLFLDCICTTVQNLFRLSFPKWFSHRVKGMETDRAIVDIVDHLFTPTAYLNNSVVGSKAAEAAQTMIPPFTPHITPQLSATHTTMHAFPPATAPGGARPSPKQHPPRSKTRIGSVQKAPRAKEKERLRDLYNTTSPLVRNIYGHGENLTSIEARHAMGNTIGLARLAEIHHQGDELPRGRSMSPGAHGSRSTPYLDPVSVTNGEVEGGLSRYSRTQLYQLALRKVEDRHEKEHSSNAAFLPRRIPGGLGVGPPPDLPDRSASSAM